MEIDFESSPITEEEVLSILGNDYQVQGDELVFACAGCRARGNDNHGDNLKFNRSKHVLKCFAGCGYDTDVVSIIARRRMEKAGISINAPKYQPQKKEKEIPQADLFRYYWNCHIDLMKDKELLKKLYQQHTILPMTAAACTIGYDIVKQKLVFPSKAIGIDPTQNDVTPNGAEYREIEGEKTVRRISGYEPKICCVWHEVTTATIGIICEGYKDAYNLWQYYKVTNPATLSHTAIFTVQNGTNSINTNNCLQKVNWRKFGVVYTCMDNDEAGDKATALAYKLFPNMLDMRLSLLKGYNDVQSMFKEKYGNQIDIEKALQAEWLKEYEKEEYIL